MTPHTITTATTTATTATANLRARPLLALAAAAALLGAAGSGLAQGGADKVARGQYLLNTSGCHDCHTPFKVGAHGPEPDMSRALSGHPEGLVMPPAPQLPPGPWLMVSAATNTAHAGPWGVSFTANLTPDADTGLGRWTVKDFVSTFRTGRHMGKGRPILPPMPIPAYSNFSDQDLEAIYAYLRTVPAISNRVPEPLAPAAAAVARQ